MPNSRVQKTKTHLESRFVMDILMKRYSLYFKIFSLPTVLIFDKGIVLNFTWP